MGSEEAVEESRWCDMAVVSRLVGERQVGIGIHSSLLSSDYVTMRALFSLIHIALAIIEQSNCNLKLL